MQVIGDGGVEGIVLQGIVVISLYGVFVEVRKGYFFFCVDIFLSQRVRFRGKLSVNRILFFICFIGQGFCIIYIKDNRVLQFQIRDCNLVLFGDSIKDFCYWVNQ